MEPFYSKFPEIAEKETRRVIMPEGRILPAGDYFFVESFCNDNNCDCRRAFINVIHGVEPLATIGYGWEDIEFYEKWMGDKSMAKDLKGPVLELGGHSSKHEKTILRLFKEVMLNDKIFIERLKKHYDMFKSSKKGKIGRNAPCPCGSGKKYKKCCLDEEDN